MIEVTAEYLASQGLSQTFCKRFWKKVDKNGPISEHAPELGHCWLWTGGLDTHGYGQICRGGGSGPLILAHRASWIINRGPIPVGLPCVLHHCDVPKCVRPEHLFTGTKQHNADDMVKKGRYKKGKIYIGADNPTSKITDEIAREIFRRSTLGLEGQKQIAKDFSISQAIVSQIHQKKLWKHIHGPQTIP